MPTFTLLYFKATCTIVFTLPHIFSSHTLPSALAISLGQFKQGDEPHWLPLRIAVEGGHETMCMYLLGLIGPQEDLSGS